ncbi:helix-turn-helix domain-containing protein [bacterium]|nr:helix-turn-helix domain-containing protein [bacterium]
MGHVIKDFKKFGKLLRQRRIVLALTQEEFGKRCGVCKNDISRIERGIAGPNVKTFKKFAEVLEIPEGKLLAWAGKDHVMDGLQELNQKVELIFDEIKGLKAQKTKTAVLSEDEVKTGGKVAIIQAVSDLQNRMEAVETGQGNPGPGVVEDVIEDVVEDQPDNPDEVVNALLDEYEGTGPDVGFFDTFLGSKEIRTAKGKTYVACCNICDTLSLDPFEEIGGIFDNSERARSMSDILYEFSTKDLDREEAQGKLIEALQDEESE